MAQRLRAHHHQIVGVPSSLSPLHCRHPIVVVVIAVDDVIVVVVIVPAAITVHITFFVVAIVAAILVVGVAVVVFAVIAINVYIVAFLTSCLSYSLSVNPRNLAKASQGGITHGMLMERLPLGWP